MKMHYLLVELLINYTNDSMHSYTIKIRINKIQMQKNQHKNQIWKN